jgi:CCR4-NOT transcription complex subunit 2
MHPPSIKPEHLTKFTLETLFYMFYSMPGDVLQMSSAHELYKREWKYQTELKLWLKLRTSLELSQSHPSVLYLFFDPSVFEVRLYSNPNVRAVITQGFLTGT